MTVFKKLLDKIERKKKSFYIYQHCNTKPKLLKARDSSQPGNHSVDHNSLKPSLQTKTIARGRLNYISKTLNNQSTFLQQKQKFPILQQRALLFNFQPSKKKAKQQ